MIYEVNAKQAKKLLNCFYGVKGLKAYEGKYVVDEDVVNRYLFSIFLNALNKYCLDNDLSYKIYDFDFKKEYINIFINKDFKYSVEIHELKSYIKCDYNYNFVAYKCSNDYEIEYYALINRIISKDLEEIKNSEKSKIKRKMNFSDIGKHIINNFNSDYTCECDIQMLSVEIKHKNGNEKKISIYEISRHFIITNVDREIEEKYIDNMCEDIKVELNEFVWSVEKIEKILEDILIERKLKYKYFEYKREFIIYDKSCEVFKIGKLDEICVMLSEENIEYEFVKKWYEDKVDEIIHDYERLNIIKNILYGVLWK